MHYIISAALFLGTVLADTTTTTQTRTFLKLDLKDTEYKILTGDSVGTSTAPLDWSTADVNGRTYLGLWKIADKVYSSKFVGSHFRCHEALIDASTVPCTADGNKFKCAGFTSSTKTIKCTGTTTGCKMCPSQRYETSTDQLLTTCSADSFANALVMWNSLDPEFPFSYGTAKFLSSTTTTTTNTAVPDPTKYYQIYSSLKYEATVGTVSSTLLCIGAESTSATPIDSGTDTKTNWIIALAVLLGIALIAAIIILVLFIRLRNSMKNNDREMGVRGSEEGRHDKH